MTLKIIVPSTTGSSRQTVKVVTIGADGQTKTIYEASQAAGETVSVSTSGAAPLILQVYVGGTMVKQIEVIDAARVMPRLPRPFGAVQRAGISPTRAASNASFVATPAGYYRQMHAAVDRRQPLPVKRHEQ